MAIKDLDTGENIDRSIKASEQKKEKPASGKGHEGSPTEADGTKVKNAHAAGSGSIGLNESSLPEEEEANDEKNKTGY